MELNMNSEYEFNFHADINVMRFCAFFSLARFNCSLSFNDLWFESINYILRAKNDYFKIFFIIIYGLCKKKHIQATISCQTLPTNNVLSEWLQIEMQDRFLIFAILRCIELPPTAINWKSIKLLTMELISFKSVKIVHGKTIYENQFQKKRIKRREKKMRTPLAIWNGHTTWRFEAIYRH